MCTSSAGTVAPTRRSFLTKMRKSVRTPPGKRPRTGTLERSSALALGNSADCEHWRSSDFRIRGPVIVENTCLPEAAIYLGMAVSCLVVTYCPLPWQSAGGFRQAAAGELVLCQ